VNVDLVELVWHKRTFLLFLSNISYHFFGNEVRQNCGQITVQTLELQRAADSQTYTDLHSQE
jgi:hypothetical protein